MPVTSDQRRALQNYGGDGYIAVNETLRGLREPTVATLAQIELIDQAISQARPDSSRTVYRGIKAVAVRELARKYTVRAGTRISFAEFLSTSRDWDVAESFRGSIDTKGLLLAISYPDRTAALDMLEFANYPDEEELLLARNLSLRVVSLDTTQGLLRLKMETHVEKPE